MANSRIAPIKEFFSACLDGYSYNVLQNTYIWFGVLWGLPVALTSLFYESKLAQNPEFVELTNLVVATPLKWIFLAHPIILGFLFGVLGTVRKEKDKQVEKLIDQLYRLSNIDALTGLNNRRSFIESYHKESARVERTERELSILLIDLDHFKRINDDYGHNVGDEILRATGNHLKSHARVYDLPARWGGEEFVLLLPQTDESQALSIAERIRKTFSVLPTPVSDLSVTASIGVTQFYSGDTLENFTERADRALYQAKEDGRNRSVVWSSLKPIE